MFHSSITFELHNCTNQISKMVTPVWSQLSQLLPARDADKDFWWNVTGSQLATMVAAAEYSVEKQYEALLFHYHWSVSLSILLSYQNRIAEIFTGRSPTWGQLPHHQAV